MSNENPPGSGKKTLSETTLPAYPKALDVKTEENPQEVPMFNPASREAALRTEGALKVPPEEFTKDLEDDEDSLPNPRAVESTPAEKRDSLREAILGGDNFEAPKETIALAEQVAMDNAQQAYIAAYKELEKKKTLWNRLSHGKSLKEDEEKLAQIKAEFDKARDDHKQALLRGNEQKLDAKEWDAARKEKVMGYLHFRNAIRPLAQKKIEARREALAERKKNVFEKGLLYAAKQNAGLEAKYGKNGARAIRSLAGAVVFAGAGSLVVTAGTLTMPSALIVAGVGTGTAFLRGVAAATLGTVGGTAAGELYAVGRGKRKQQEAASALVHSGLNASGSYDEIDAARLKLASRADERTFQGKKQFVRALAAFGIGGAAALEIAHAFPSFTPEIEGVPGAESATDVPNEIAPNASATTPEAAPSEIPTSTPEVLLTPEGSIADATIKQGEGFSHLAARIPVSGVENPSAVAQYLAGAQPQEIAEKLGALVDGKSAVMQIGDKVFLDDNQNLFFVRPGETPQLLLENDPSAVDGIKVHELQGIEMRDYTMSATPGQSASVPQAEVASTPDSSVEISPAPEVTASVEQTTEASAVDTQATAPETSPRTLGRSVGDYLASPGEENVVLADTTPATASAPQTEAPQQEVKLGRSIGDYVAERQSADTEVPSEVGENVDVTTESSPYDPYVNAKGVEITPAKPSAYQWQMDPLQDPQTVVTGGTPEEAMRFAQEFSKNNPGVTVYFRVEVPNTLTGETYPRLDAFVTSESGVLAKEVGVSATPNRWSPPANFSTDFITNKIT